MMMRRRGVNLIEIIIALFVAIFALVALIGVFSGNYKYSTMSRNRSVAAIVAHSLMDEVEAHPYGMKTPPEWKELDYRPVSVYIEGKPQDMTLHKKIEWKGGFDGTTTEITDLVTITLSWREGVGPDEVPDSDDDHKIVIEMPVWK